MLSPARKQKIHESLFFLHLLYFPLARCVIRVKIAALSVKDVIFEILQSSQPVGKPQGAKQAVGGHFSRIHAVEQHDRKI
jgi:hypothetical protein